MNMLFGLTKAWFTVDDIIKAARTIIYWFFLLIDGVVYNIVSWLYEIFVFLAGANLFEQDTYSDIVKRFYVILGLIMLFVLAYSLLRAVINPDEFAKGESSFPKLISNVVISLIIIVFLPTGFQLAFNVQNSILNYNTIPRIIMGSDYQETVTGSDNPGRTMAYEVFTSFFYLKEDADEGAQEDYNAAAEDVNGGMSFTRFADLSSTVAEDQIMYIFIVSTIGGAFVAYILLNFCFDMALRLIRLMFFEIIAPIPVFCRIIPGGKTKDIFSTWLKKTISTFIDVFVRIFAIYIGVFILKELLDNGSLEEALSNSGLGWDQRQFARALIIMGVVMFIREAPKLMGDIFHLEIGNMKLGIMDKLAAGGALFAGAAVGGALTSGTRNLVSGVKNGKGLFGTAASTLAGATSGGLRSAWGARGAKKLGDVGGAIKHGTDIADANKSKRELYRAQYDQGKGWIDTTAGVIGGHIMDAGGAVGKFLGVSSGAQELIEDNKVIDDIASKKKAVRQAAEDLIVGEANKNKNKSFGVAGFSTKELREKRQAMELAKSSGAANAAQLENDYGKYLSDFTDAVQNQALLSNENYENMLKDAHNVNANDDALGLESDLAAVRSAAGNYRAVLMNNLTSTSVQQAGFTVAMLGSDKDIKIKDPESDNLSKYLNINKQKNMDELSRLREQEEKKDKNH